LAVAIEIGPVHRYDDCLGAADQVRHPAGEAFPDVDALVAEQPWLCYRILAQECWPILAQLRSRNLRFP
jgi:hypothetical protein